MGWGAGRAVAERGEVGREVGEVIVRSVRVRERRGIGKAGSAKAGQGYMVGAGGEVAMDIDKAG